MKVTKHASDPKITIVIIENPNGDDVPFAALPPPFNTPIPTKQGPGIFAYHWTYEDKQYGYGYLTVTDTGQGTFQFQFSNGKKLDGDTFSAWATLIDATGKGLHSFIGQAGVNAAGFSGGAKERFVDFSLVRPADWWKSIVTVRIGYRMIDSVDDGVVGDALKKIAEALLSPKEETEIKKG